MKKACFISGILYIAFNSVTSSSSLALNPLQAMGIKLKTQPSQGLKEKKLSMFSSPSLSHTSFVKKSTREVFLTQGGKR